MGLIASCLYHATWADAWVRLAGWSAASRVAESSTPLRALRVHTRPLVINPWPFHFSPPHRSAARSRARLCCVVDTARGNRPGRSGPERRGSRNRWSRMATTTLEKDLVVVGAAPPVRAGRADHDRAQRGRPRRDGLDSGCATDECAHHRHGDTELSSERSSEPFDSHDLQPFHREPSDGTDGPASCS